MSDPTGRFLKRLTRAALSDEQRNVLRWQEPSTSTWSTKDQQRYNRLKSALSDYLAGEKVTGIEAKYKVRISQIQEQLWRAMQLDTNNVPLGFLALTRGLQVVDTLRHKPLPRGSSPSPSSCKAGMMHILQKENLYEYVLDRVFKRGPGPHAAKLSRKRLTNDLVKLLKARGYKDNEYPFNTKGRMYSSICRLVNELRDSNVVAYGRANESDVVVANVNVNSGTLDRQLRPLVLDEVEADEFKLHGIGSVTINVDGIDKVIPTERPVGIVLIDRGSGVILGGAVCLSTEASEESLIAAIRHAVVPEAVVTLPNGEPAPAFRACDFVPEIRGRVWTVLCIDNARIHTSDHYLTTSARIGNMTCWGPLGSWSGRPNIESVFAKIVGSYFTQLPSSTGAGPARAGRRSPVQQAVKYDISHSDLCRFFYLALAKVNVEVSGGKLYQRPIDVLAADARQQHKVLLRTLPPSSAYCPEIGDRVVSATVRQQSKTNHNLYVHHKHKYSGDAISKRRDLLGKRVLLHVSPNLRSVRAYECSGRPIGILDAEGHWGSTDHNEQVRQAVIKDRYLRYRDDDASPDPVTDLLIRKSRRVLEADRKRPKEGIAKGALELASHMEATSTRVVMLTSQRPAKVEAEINTTSTAADFARSIQEALKASMRGGSSGD